MNQLIPASIMGVRIPDTALVRDAIRMIDGAQPKHLCNHCLRAFVLGSHAFQKAGRSYDEELAFVACALHDIGLIDEFASADARFEIDGADAASALMQSHGETSERVTVVWDAISLHNTIGIAERKSPESALVLAGVGMDVAGLGIDEVPSTLLGELIETLPILGFPRAFEALVTRRVLAKPQAHMFTWGAEMVMDAGHLWPCSKAATQLRNSPLANMAGNTTAVAK